MTIKITTRGHAVTDAWRTETPFTTHGALRGSFLTAGSASELGRLPDAERAIWRDDVKRYGRRLFVVWSYGTPIAWRCGDYTYRPAVRYSVTTSKHQGRIY